MSSILSDYSQTIHGNTTKPIKTYLYPAEQLEFVLKRKVLIHSKHHFASFEIFW